MEAKSAKSNLELELSECEAKLKEKFEEVEKLKIELKNNTEKDWVAFISQPY